MDNTKTVEELEARVREIKEEVAENERKQNDPNATGEEKNLARRRNDDLNIDLEAIKAVVKDGTDIRIGTKTALIFKIMGVTLASLAIVAGLVISAITLATTKAAGCAASAVAGGAKAAGKKVAKWLWDLAKKVATAIPGIIGSLLSWLLKTAASVVNYLAEHTWLLLVAALGLLVGLLRDRNRRRRKKAKDDK